MLQSNVTSGGSYLYIKSNDLCPVGEGLEARDLELEIKDYYAESQSFWRYWDETHGRPNANESHHRLDNEMIFRKIDEEDQSQSSFTEHIEMVDINPRSPAVDGRE